MKIEIEMPEEMVRALRNIATASDVTVGQVVRDAVVMDLRRRKEPKSDGRSDEGLVASLRSLLARDLADATGWDDLDRRLRCHGYAMMPAGGGLILTCAETGRKRCKASELGYAHAYLARRFGAPFPDHPHNVFAGVDRSREHPRRPSPSSAN